MATNSAVWFLNSRLYAKSRLFIVNFHFVHKILFLKSRLYIKSRFVNSRLYCIATFAYSCSETTFSPLVCFLYHGCELPQRKLVSIGDVGRGSQKAPLMMKTITERICHTTNKKPSFSLYLNDEKKGHFFALGMHNLTSISGQHKSHDLIRNTSTEMGKGYVLMHWCMGEFFKTVSIGDAQNSWGLLSPFT